MKINKTTIEFINHASVLINYGEIGILSDPWYAGSVFHKGWRLLHENEKNYIHQTLDKTSHIYLSHEHPDHFNPKYLLSDEIKDKIINNNITFLFQKTKDRRVISFLKSKGFTVQEISPKKTMISKDVEIQIINHDFYDSSISIKTPDTKLLNLNDCPLRDIKEIKNFKKKFGEFDVLLTQFSYAAWKGGKNGKKIRESAAEEKLNDVYNQSKILNCKVVIPFASFIYFSNKINFYMNDSINTPKKVSNYLNNKKIKSVFMSPGEKQILSELKQNTDSLDFWNKKFSQIYDHKEMDFYNKKKEISDLKIDFEDYQKKLFLKNSKLLILILSKLSFIGAFQNINIFLADKNKNYKYSIFDGLIEINEDNYDILMHSESLAFIFKNDFGFDTLTVNGCFECDAKNFSKITKTLAIGSLNAMGYNLNFTMVFKLNVVLLFLKKLLVFVKKLK